MGRDSEMKRGMIKKRKGGEWLWEETHVPKVVGSYPSTLYRTSLGYPALPGMIQNRY